MIKRRMTEALRDERAPATREYRLALLAVAVAVLFRSAIFVFVERAHFDADQAITGLMAKHLAELRAFPVFYYGQSYMLAVEAWLAAPLIALFGASVTALKLPLLAINLAIAWLLLRGFVREVGLRPAVAVVPTLFFALPAAGTSARMVEAMGGNVEPFLYVLLIWVLRHRPGWCGFVLGLGFLQREFVLYGFGALLVIESLQGELFTRTGLKRRLVTLRTAAEVWLVVFWVKQYSSGAGPGTTLADVYQPRDNISELASRVCMDPGTVLPGFGRIVTDHWPVLFGTASYPLRDFGIQSAAVTQGGWTETILLALLAATAALGLLRAFGRPWRLEPRSAFCAFLVVTALLSMTGYVVGRCGAIDFYYTRYELLSLLGMAGLAAWFLRHATSRRARTAWLAAAAVWFALTAVPHAKLYREYIVNPPEDIRRLIIRHLDARGARFASSTYWIAYPITFLSGERIIVGSEDFVRIQEYERSIERQGGKVVRISREPCGLGNQIARGVYLCEP